MNRTKIIKIIVFLLTTILYGLYMVWRCSYVGINSDFANLVLEGKDILSGNLFRRDWNLTGISFLTTDLPYFVVGTILFGVSNRAYIFACALMDVVLVLAAYLLVRDACKKNRLVSDFIMLAFAMTPCHFAVDILRAHTGVLILGFILIYIFYVLLYEKTVATYKRVEIYVLYLVVLALAVMGDPIILIVLFMPMCLWIAISWLGKRLDNGKMLCFLGVNVFGAALGVLLDKLYFYIGGANKNSFLESKTFISFDQLEEKIILYVKSIFFMADAGFEKQQMVSINSVFYAINSIAIVLFFILIIYNIACFCIDKKYDFITVILGTGFLIISALYIGTSISVDVNSARYMSYFPALMSVVFVRNISLISKRDRWYCAVGVVLVIAFIGKVNMTINDSKSIPTEQIKLAKYLEDNGLTNGYTSFWNASSTTVISSEKVKLRAISADGYSIQMYNWCCKNEWYKENQSFIVTKDDDIMGVTPGNIESAVGKPQKVLECDKYRIFVYDQDLSKLLK